MKCDAFRLLQQQGHTRESDPERLPLSSEQSSRVGALPWRLDSFRGKTLHPLCLLSLSLSQSKISVTREQQCAEREEIDGVPPAAQKQTQAFLALGCSAWLISGHVSTDAVWIYVTKSQCVRLAACACLRRVVFSGYLLLQTTFLSVADELLCVILGAVVLHWWSLKTRLLLLPLTPTLTLWTAVTFSHNIK